MVITVIITIKNHSYENKYPDKYPDKMDNVEMTQNVYNEQKRGEQQPQGVSSSKRKQRA